MKIRFFKVLSAFKLVHNKASCTKELLLLLQRVGVERDGRQAYC